MARFSFNPLQSVSPNAAPTAGFSQRAGADAFGGQAADARLAGARTVGAAAAGAAERLGAAQTDAANRTGAAKIAAAESVGGAEMTSADKIYSARMSLSQATSQFGAALEQAGDVASKHALVYQALNNETEAKQADVGFDHVTSNILFDPKDGYFSKTGQHALDAYGPTMEALEKARQDALGTLNNPMAKKMADDVFVQKIGRLEPTMGEHAAQQRKVWMNETSNARIASATQEAVNFFGDPIKQGQAFATIKDEVLSQGEQNGWSPEFTKQTQDKAVSNAMVSVIDRQAVADPLKAQATYQANTDLVLPENRAQVERVLKSATTPVLTRNGADMIMNGGRLPNSLAADAVVKGPPAAGVQLAMAQAESGNRDTSTDGTPVTSPKGAKFAMQVMPATAVSPGFGVAPAKDGSAAESDRVGRDYYAAMLSRYGNQTVALAAYNWGPGNVDKALARVGSGPGESGLVNEAAFLKGVPAETQEYVGRINAQAPPTAQQPPTSTDVKAHLADWMQQGRQLAEQMFPNDPAAQDQLVSNIEQKSGEIMKGQTYKEQDARNTVFASVFGLSQLADGSFVQTPVSQRPQTLQQLLSDPKVAQAWSTMDSIQQTAILSKIGKSDVPVTAQTLANKNTLLGMSHTDPADFMKLDFSAPEYVDSMPRADIAAMMSEQHRMNVQGGKDAIKAQQWNYGMSIAKTVPGYVEAGIPTSTPTKKTPTAQREAYQQFGQRLNEQVEAYQEQNKKLPPADEVRKMASSLLVQATIPHSGWLWNKKEPAFAITPDDTSRQQITDGFRKQYGRNPLPAEVSSIYQAHVLKNGVPKE